LVIPQLQPGDNIVPRLVDMIKTVKGWDAFSTFKLPKISLFLIQKFILPRRGHSQSKAVSQKRHSRNFTKNFRNLF
jgi:hypothetical protein